MILCRDSNMKIENIEAVTAAIEVGGWHDVGKVMGEQGREWPTYSGEEGWDKYSWTDAPRPDIILMNSQAVAICKSFNIRRDLTIMNHLGLEMEMEVGGGKEEYKVMKKPKEFKLKRGGQLWNREAS